MIVERLRGRAGQRQRLQRLRDEPLCRQCARKGIVTPAAVPDHIVPLAKGGSDDDANIRCLCHDCHRDVRGEQFGQAVRPRIGLDGWPLA